MFFKLLDMKRGRVMEEGLRTVADKLNFSEAVASLISRNGGRNALKNAVLSAREKRNTCGQSRLAKWII